MPPPHDGNVLLPFVELMKLRKIDDTTYQSIALPFTPGGQLDRSVDRAYGGHVYAQAAWAAAQTVTEGFHIYNVVGTFILAGQLRIPFIYHIHKIRDGRSIASRAVTVTQGESDAICFSGLISFKKPETSLINVQETVDLWEKYKAVLDGKKPTDFPEAPSMDIPWFLTMQKETGYHDEFPGLDTTKPDMTPYDADRHPLDRRGLMFYRAYGDMPPDPNLHLCAHLYASDRNSLYLIPNQMGMGDLWTTMSSLVHMTAFHASAEELMFGPSKSNEHPMDDTSKRGKWFANEDWSTRSSNGRAMFHGRMFAPDGTQVATLTQDGMIRYTKKAEATPEEAEELRRRQRKWKPKGKL